MKYLVTFVFKIWHTLVTGNLSERGGGGLGVVRGFGVGVFRNGDK